MALYKDHLAAVTPYVAGIPLEELKRRYNRADFVKLNSNESPLGASPAARQAILDELEHLHLYPDPSNLDLRGALARKFDLDPDCILVHHGGEAAMDLVAQACISERDEVLMPVPTFPFFPICARTMNARQRTVPMRDQHFDIPALLAALTAQTKVLYIANPNNPTGTVLNQTEFDTLLAALGPDQLLLHDEAYFEFADPDSRPDSLEAVRQGKNVVVLRSFSKAYGLAGLRVGYLVANPTLIEKMRSVRVTFAPNRLGQAAALAAVLDEQHLADTVTTVLQGRAYLATALTELGVSYWPSQGNFLLFDPGLPASQVTEGLMAEGIIVRPSVQNHLRVTVGLPEHNRAFISALAKVLEEYACKA